MGKYYGLNELRDMFLRYFESKDHLAMPSFSLVPHNDNSLLLINAGMAPLKPYFAGLETGSRPWSRIHTRLRKDGSEYPSAPKWFIEVVEGWAATKGVNLDSPWGVATKIMTSGSALFRDGGRDDIFSNEIPVAFDNVASRLAGLFDVQLTESILRTINN